MFLGNFIAFNNGIVGRDVYVILNILSTSTEYFCIIGFISNCAHVGLLIDDTCNNIDNKFDKLALYVSGIFGYFPLITFLNNSFILFALNGGVKHIISYKTIPNDHISDFKS